MAEALDRARTEPVPAAPPTGAAPPPATPDRLVLGRADLAIEDRVEPIALNGSYELRRLPAGLARSGERHLRPSATAGELDVHVVSFDGDSGAGSLVGLDVRIVRGTPEDVARAQHEALEARSAVERTAVGGREALAYDTGVASRTLRWVDRRGTLVVLEGIGLSRAALADIAVGVARTSS